MLCSWNLAHTLHWHNKHISVQFHRCTDKTYFCIDFFVAVDKLKLTKNVIATIGKHSLLYRHLHFFDFVFFLGFAILAGTGATSSSSSSSSGSSGTASTGGTGPPTDSPLTVRPSPNTVRAKSGSKNSLWATYIARLRPSLATFTCI